MRTRQPIVSVLGHVDHGKTTFLDRIRGSGVAEREAGRITQHIGATEVPTEIVHKVCGSLTANQNFSVPGLLFIDTPGHESFTTLRSRGGSLADLAILIIDVMEGLMPQTIESINILKTYKTPFLIGLNKVDRINGWKVGGMEPFCENISKQDEMVKQYLDDRIYEIIGDLGKHGFNAHRYDKVQDFTKTIGMVPMVATEGMGIPDALMLLIGLAQRYLEESLLTADGPGEGTILEVKEEKGLGTTLDTIIYSGTIRREDTIVVGTRDEPAVLRVKSLLKPKALDEIRDPKQRFDNIDEIIAASGVKILAKDSEDVISGAPLRVARDGITVEDAYGKVKELTEVSIDLDPEGIYIKADAIGSLEALSNLLLNKDVSIYKAEVGDISERDVKDVGSFEDPLRRIILAFNIKTLPEVEDLAEEMDVKLIVNNVIYKIIEDYQEWIDETKKAMDEERRSEYAHPAKFLVLRDHVFRISKPAVVGVRILAGRVRSGHHVMRGDGKRLGRIASLQTEGKTIKEAKMGQEVAMAIEGPMVGRHFNEEDILYMEIPENRVGDIEDSELTVEEKETLEKILEVKRSEKPTWGMG